MNQAYQNVLAAAGAEAITHLGLVDEAGQELRGGDPLYSRQPVTWTTPVDGVIHPTADLVFNVAAGATVAGWRCYSAVTRGTDYDGAPLPIERYTNQGQYTLIASDTGIAHRAGDQVCV